MSHAEPPEGPPDRERSARSGDGAGLTALTVTLMLGVAVNLVTARAASVPAPVALGAAVVLSGTGVWLVSGRGVRWRRRLRRRLTPAGPEPPTHTAHEPDRAAVDTAKSSDGWWMLGGTVLILVASGLFVAMVVLLPSWIWIVWGVLTVLAAIVTCSDQREQGSSWPWALFIGALAGSVMVTVLVGGIGALVVMARHLL